MRRLALIAALMTATPPSLAVAAPCLVRAAPASGSATWSPRRLFNAGLGAEEKGDPLTAVRLYLAARLADRHSFADELYAKGAGLRLIRVLAGYDDDAATAVALLVEDEVERPSTDLAPLIRTLVRRLDPEEGRELELVHGRVDALRFRDADGAAVVEIGLADGTRRTIAAHGPIGPFSAGDEVRALVRRDRHGEWNEWRLVSMAFSKKDGWGLLAVEGLADRAVPHAEHRAPLRPAHRR